MDLSSVMPLLSEETNLMELDINAGASHIHKKYQTTVPTRVKNASVTVSSPMDKSSTQKENQTLCGILLWHPTMPSMIGIIQRLKHVNQRTSNMLSSQSTLKKDVSVTKTELMLLRLMSKWSKNTGEVLWPRKPLKRRRPEEKLKLKQLPRELLRKRLREKLKKKDREKQKRLRRREERNRPLLKEREWKRQRRRDKNVRTRD